MPLPFFFLALLSSGTTASSLLPSPIRASIPPLPCLIIPPFASLGTCGIVPIFTPGILFISPVTLFIPPVTPLIIPITVFIAFLKNPTIPSIMPFIKLYISVNIAFVVL